ncbi:2-amino-3,7-dideoxy-D-threo-hept-6-ulosonate synthase [Streptomyces alkaliterrae]|uniref:Fructose-bisphosphate aldolase n=1 Tax=Streptomyces alkaliterrae TaxID=2213162 RepID=A0A5P0YVK7_9ACTN|nr:2-amino-3,7-dideoxy-D-threo-hept-6-ulosonate synthase [Streptomyces alkaliterrae]MBB1255827.1 fructose-bisphosphate aldolase [Streptomyces alkaliterrae]MBB1261914.1 fructose-bisphosphate aldolase [Streptomyces alkaliterrae]MQS04328.1 fructose-bisphosphate aldolase [Streptomyces alkaliterrae]
MARAALPGTSLRLARLSGHGDGRFLLVPLDHSVSDGPIGTADGYDALVRDIVAGGADGIVVHKGRARLLDQRLLTRCSLVVHLSASTAHAPDADAKVLVADVEEAVRLGADAVSVHVNIGSDTEAAQLADLGAVASACHRWGMPLLAMIYPRGPRLADPTVPGLIAHVAAVAADLGADLVKTVYAGSPDRMAEVVATSPLPILVAGGADGRQELGDFARTALAAGCRGLAVGRRVFTSRSPADTVRELAGIVHGPGELSGPTDTPLTTTSRLAGVL